MRAERAVQCSEGIGRSNRSNLTELSSVAFVDHVSIFNYPSEDSSEGPAARANSVAGLF